MTKIAICSHGGGFTPRWIEYCKNHNIEYKLVCAYDDDIVEQLRDCSAFMWHHNHGNISDHLFAKQLLQSLQSVGLKVFPNAATGWHFDDKVGQKYLLEATGVPFIKTHVFYDKESAKEWARKTDYPIVFKLRGGAGSSNVKLIKNKNQAFRTINKSFSKGWHYFDSWGLFKDCLKKFFNGTGSFRNVAKYAYIYLRGLVLGDDFPKQKGYVYFQEFIPNNEFDIRVCVVNDKAFALKRMARKGDFRASGSGKIIYDKNQIDIRCVKVAFDANKALRSQSTAFDFVFDKNGNPFIVEISYGYTAKAYDVCEGYWTDDMQWHEGTNFDFCGWMVESVI